MALGTSSGGWGFGPFGETLNFGEGPWLTFPFTPGFPAATDASYLVEVVEFEDMTEQRFLVDTNQRRQLIYSFTPNDSAQFGAIQSWFIAAGGRYERFVVLDHQEGRTYVCRFGQDFVARNRGPALHEVMEWVSFDIEDEVT
jgi:hypothetical protein